MNSYPSWGRFPLLHNQEAIIHPHRFTNLPTSSKTILPRGAGLSYGDSCLNEDGILVVSSRLNHFIAFDRSAGILRCESGVTFDQVLKLVVPHGWFLPVTPGTKHVTVGGAIANDVHGKNHHHAGTFGHHVSAFEVLKSNGERLLCTRNLNPELFHATLGGLGLTGMITWAEFQLTRINSSWLVQEQIQFNSLAEFLRLSAESNHSHEFTVAWVDCLSAHKDIRGLFIRANPAAPRASDNYQIHHDRNWLEVPTWLPTNLLNRPSVKVFNELYYHKNLKEHDTSLTHYDSFFYPLDAVQSWNRIYGKAGLLQYQCVVPHLNDGGQAITEIFQLIKRFKQGSFLAVLKVFGDRKSEGLLSFPREGITLTMDFPNRGEELFKLLNQCDEIVRSARGAVYPAKDARMSKASFESFFPRISDFEKHVDPHFSSSFWRRVR